MIASLLQGLNRTLIVVLLLTVGACGLLVGACAHGPGKRKLVYEQELPVEERVTPYKSSFGEIQLEINGSVNKWIAYYQGRGRPHMVRYLERSTRYEDLMKAVLRAEGLPEELFYLVFVESGFSAKAYSHASAVGYWQFIHSTGKMYGLIINGFIDERRDALLSTEASSQYLKSLYNLFGDWKLALAAYNVGENRVKRAAMKYKTRNYWEMATHRWALPRETREYVAKFMAAFAIGKNPELYGFTNIAYEKPLEFDALKVSAPISLKKLADNLQIDFEELKNLNPRYRTDFVPIYKEESVLVRLPVGYKEKGIAALEASATKAPVTAVANGFLYRVRRGDTLSTIAQRHYTSIRLLREANHLGSRSFIRVGQRLFVPERSYRVRSDGESVASKRLPPAAPAATPSFGTVAAASEDSGVHVVKSGDSLYTIAKKYSTTIDQLRRLNNLRRRSIIRPGQYIRYRGPQEQSLLEKKIQKNYQGKIHLVRRGETLTRIAKKYKTSIARIAKTNKIHWKSNLLAGMKLVIP